MRCPGTHRDRKDRQHRGAETKAEERWDRQTFSDRMMCYVKMKKKKNETF